MNGFDIGVTRKIFSVERQDVFDPVHMHCGNQSRVVEPARPKRHVLPTSDATLREERGRRGGVEASLRKSGGVVCVLRGKAIAIAINRAGTGIPKLCNIL